MRRKIPKIANIEAERRWAHASCEEIESIKEFESNADLINSPIGELIELAMLYMCPCHDGQRALGGFNAALGREPVNTEIMYWTAYCLNYEVMGTEAWKRALGLVDQIISMDKSNLGEAYMMKVWLLEALGNLAIAEKIRLYEKSVEIDPTWVNNRYYLGVEYKKNRQRAEALFQFEQALKNSEIDAAEITCRKEEVFEYEIKGRGRFSTGSDIETIKFKSEIEELKKIIEKPHKSISWRWI